MSPLRVACAAAGLGGALTTLLATLTPIIAVHSADVSGWDRHGAALPLLAMAAIALLLTALRGAVAGAAGVAAVGVAVLALAVIADLPHVHDTGSVGDIAHLQRANPGAGYYLETAGGVLLLVAGGLMLLIGERAATEETPAQRRGDSRRSGDAGERV